MMAGLREWAKHHTAWTIHKYDASCVRLPGESIDDFMARCTPFEVAEFQGNVLLNEGINNVLTPLLGGTSSPTAYTNAAAYLGVGDSSTAEAATQTALQAAANYAHVGMESGYPTAGSSQQIVWRASFGSAVANFAWNEFTVVNASSDTGDNLLRKVSSQGTKTSGQTWVLTLTVTFS